MNTYGFHSIHGRAPAIATGLKSVRPDLQVWVITGDGDGLSIGGNHLMHGIRRNVDLKIILFNNQIYGLTKGQYSPTSPLGKVTKSTPYGSIDNPLHPLSVAIGCEATFVARTVDVDIKHLADVLKRAAEHKGTAFVEVYQNCNIFNDGAFEYATDKDIKADNVDRPGARQAADLRQGQGQGHPPERHRARRSSSWARASTRTTCCSTTRRRPSRAWRTCSAACGTRSSPSRSACSAPSSARSTTSSSTARSTPPRQEGRRRPQRPLQQRRNLDRRLNRTHHLRVTNASAELEPTHALSRLTNAIQHRRAADEELAAAGASARRGRSRPCRPGSVVLGDDLQRFARLDDEGLAGFVQEIDEAIGGDRRAAVFAVQPLFPIDVAVLRVVAGGDAVHVGRR